MKPRLLVLAGPTAVGKTALSLAVAEALNGEILGADSMQVYRGMDIGTAKATAAERASVPHHMIDVADPAEPFSVASYVALARPIIRDIIDRGRLPIVVGGTGFYIQALIRDLDYAESEGPSPGRESLWEEARQGDPAQLWHRLKAVDPLAAQRIHPNNIKRVIRALEYYEETGQPISALNAVQEQQESPYDLCYLVLTRPREQLYKRVEIRAEAMMDQGLEEEVRRLLDRGVPLESTALQAIGYKEMVQYIRGAISREEALGQIKLASRHYVKRQLTWFKREKEARWVDLSAFSAEKEARDAILDLAGGR